MVIVSKTSLINATANSILDAVKLGQPESVAKALNATGEMLYRNVTEIDQADQIEILAGIRDVVNERMNGNSTQTSVENPQFGKLMGSFAHAFVSASESMGLTDSVDRSLRQLVTSALCTNMAKEPEYKASARLAN